MVSYTSSKRTHGTAGTRLSETYLGPPPLTVRLECYGSPLPAMPMGQTLPHDAHECCGAATGH